MFRVGQRVTPAQRQGTWTNDLGEVNTGGPQFGEVYVVERTKVCTLGCCAGEQAVWLVAVSGIYASHSFRPVVDTDISIFTAMLNPVKEDALR